MEIGEKLELDELMKMTMEMVDIYGGEISREFRRGESGTLILEVVHNIWAGWAGLL